MCHILMLFKHAWHVFCTKYPPVVQKNTFWVSPRERFLPSILYMTQFSTIFDKKLFILYNFWAERCGQDRPSIFNKIHIYLGLGQVQPLSELSAAARTDQGAERCGQDRLGGRTPRLGQAIGGRALRPHDQLYPCLKYEMHVQN